MLTSPGGVTVAQLSAKAMETWKNSYSNIQHIRVVGMLVRKREDCRESEYRSRLHVDQWEIPICELTL